MVTETKDIKYCVYLHTNVFNDKKYVGISKNYEKRWSNGKGYSGQPKFYYAIRRYGWGSFKHKILENDLSLEEAYEKEILYIKEYDSIYNGYNISKGGKSDIHEINMSKRQIEEQIRKNIEEMPIFRIEKTLHLAEKILYPLTDKEEEIIHKYYLEGDEYKEEFLKLKSNMETKMLENIKIKTILGKFLEERKELYLSRKKYQRADKEKLKAIDEKYKKILGEDPLLLSIIYKVDF